MAQTFIPEGSGPLEVLPRLSCCSFPLTLIVKHGDTKRCPKGSPIFQIFSSLPPLWTQSSFPIVVSITHSSNTVTLFLASGHLKFQFNGIIIMFLVKVFLSQYLRPLGQQSIKSQEQELGLYCPPHSHPTSSSSSFHRRPYVLSIKQLPNSLAGVSHHTEIVCLFIQQVSWGPTVCQVPWPFSLWGPESSETKTLKTTISPYVRINDREGCARDSMGPLKKKRHPSWSGQGGIKGFL